jgi:hypothetical protein
MDRSRQFFIAPQQSGRDWLYLSTTETGLVYPLKGNPPQRWTDPVTTRKAPLRNRSGFTEGADADLTDAQLRAAGRHREAGRFWFERSGRRSHSEHVTVYIA